MGAAGVNKQEVCGEGQVTRQECAGTSRTGNETRIVRPEARVRGGGMEM